MQEVGGGRDNERNSAATDVRKTLRQAMAFSISPAAVKVQVLLNGWKALRSPEGTPYYSKGQGRHAVATMGTPRDVRKKDAGACT